MEEVEDCVWVCAERVSIEVVVVLIAEVCGAREGDVGDDDGCVSGITITGVV